MELKDLVGNHTLDAVDFESVRRRSYGDHFEDCSVCRFRLDGVVYAAIEDPNDGYRSAMRALQMSDTNTITNVFPEIKVIGRYRETREYGGEADILELVDETTGKVVLEVGTDNTDDYYPSFVSNFQPENMITNFTSVQDALVAALKDMCSEFRQADLPYGSPAYVAATSLLAKHGGAA